MLSPNAFYMRCAVRLQIRYAQCKDEQHMTTIARRG